MNTKGICMKKIALLLFLLLATLGLLSGYLYLTEKIIAGNIKIAAGKKQIEEGEQMLARGQGKLARGKRQLSELKGANSLFQSIPFMHIADKVPVGGAVLNLANDKIHEGDQQVRAGEDKIKNGEKQLAEGKIDLQKGIQKLYEANIIRMTCGIGAFVMSMILLGFLIYWRKDLTKMIWRKT